MVWFSPLLTRGKSPRENIPFGDCLCKVENVPVLGPERVEFLKLLLNVCKILFYSSYYKSFHKKKKNTLGVVNKKFYSWSWAVPARLLTLTGETGGEPFFLLINHNSVGAPAKALTEWQRSWTQNEEVDSGFIGALKSPRLGPSRNGNEEASTCTKTGTSTQYPRKQVESEFHTYLCREEKLKFRGFEKPSLFLFSATFPKEKVGRTCSQSSLLSLLRPVRERKLTKPQQEARGQARVPRPAAPDVSGHSACVRSPAAAPTPLWGRRLAGTGI